MTTRDRRAEPLWKCWAREAGFILLGAWIFGGAVFYYLRFTTVLYDANRGAIEALRSSF
jgi:hypothetical protein